MKITTPLQPAALVVTLASFATVAPVQSADLPPVDEIKAIAEEAILYGLPLVMLYGIMNEYGINKDSSEFKAPFNEIKNEPRGVYACGHRNCHPQ